MVLFFDTETTGIPRNYKAPVSDLANWPRLVQLAWLVADADGNEVRCVEHIIKPQGFVIPADAVRIHGISTEMAEQAGVDLGAALAEIASDLAAARVLVAHNMPFDEKILGAEFLRAGQSNPIAVKPRMCTMQSSTDLCQLPGRYGFKWPSLDELHRKLFKQGVDGAHQALADVRACARCYFELRRRGVMG
jgi:DNA polymerase III epsilon subunit-like protein